MKVVWRLLAVCLLLAVGTRALQTHARVSENLPPLSVPLKTLSRLAASGFENVLADGLFLQFIQHFGGSVREKRRVQQAGPVLDLVTDLDPRFFGAYMLGTMALGDAQELEAVERLWEKAERALPGDWRVPYQAGMTLFLFGRETSHVLKAARWFARAAQLPGAPAEARYMEARMYQEGARRQLAIDLWTTIYRHDPRPTARAVAKKTLLEWGVTLP